MPPILPPIPTYELELPPDIIALQHPYYKSDLQKSNPEEYGTADHPVFVKVIPSEPSPEQEKREIEKAELDRKLTDYTGDLAFYTKFLVGFTAILAIVTGALAWVAGRQMKEARASINASVTAAKAARDSADALPATERPYVLVIGGGFLDARPEITQIPDPVVLYRCGNYGKTPGIVENLRAGFSRNGNGRPDLPNPIEGTHAVMLIRILTAGQEISPLWVVYPDNWTTVGVWVNRGGVMLGVREPDIPEGEELSLRIIVNYRGAFTRGHETSACWRYSVQDAMFLHHGGDEYNYER